MAKAKAPATPKAGPSLLLSALAPAAGASKRDAMGQSWLITFTDLVALLITFFVMLFAMSQVEARQWQNLTDALARNLNLVREIGVALPADDLDIKTVERLPGTDLDYLLLLLEQHMESEPLLADGLLRRQEDRIVILLPGELLFASGAAELTQDGARAAFALTSVLRNLENRIEVTGSADPTPTVGAFPSNWELSLARAVQVAALLSDAGYRRPVVARGLGESRFGQLSPELSPAQRGVLARRVDITVHEDAGELRR